MTRRQAPRVVEKLRVLATLLLGLSLPAVAAEKPATPAAAEALDAEFLEYLSNFEGKDEDWTWFAEDAERPAKPAAKQPPSTAKPAAEK
jgi:hypothetical protein